MNKILALWMVLFVALPVQAQSPVIWGPVGSAPMLNDGPLVTKRGTAIESNGLVNLISNTDASTSLTVGGVSSPGGGLSREILNDNVPLWPVKKTAFRVEADGAGGSSPNLKWCVPLPRAFTDTPTVLALAFNLALDSQYVNEADVGVSQYTSSNCSTGGTALPLVGGVQTTTGFTVAGEERILKTTSFYDTFSTLSTSSGSYLGVYLAPSSGSANPYPLYINNVYVGPGLKTQTNAAQYLGSIGTWTVAGNGSKTFTVSDKCWRVVNRIKCSLFLDGNATASGSAAGTAFTFSPPSGYTPDTSAIAGAVGAASSYVGTFSSQGVTGVSTYADTSSLYLDAATTIGFVKGGGTGSIQIADLNQARNMDFFVDLDMPIAEWANSGVTMLSDSVVYDAAKFRVASTSTSTVANNATMALWSASAQYDTANGYNGSSTYTAPAAGKYRVTAQLSGSGATAVIVNVVKNGSTTIASSVSGSTRAFISGVVECVKGDTITIVRSGGGTLTLDGTSQGNYFEVERLPDRTSMAGVGFSQATQTSLGLVKAGQVPGTNTNDDAEIDKVGYFIESSTAGAVSCGAATTVAFNATSIVLPTAGDWQVCGSFGGRLNGATSSLIEGCLTTTSASASGCSTFPKGYFAFAPAAQWTTQNSCMRFKTSAQQTIYLIGVCTYSAGTPQTASYMYAWRRR